MQIDARAHAWHGKALSNFSELLPSPQSDLAQQALKDPYIFDFLTLSEPFHERELETELVRHLARALDSYLDLYLTYLYPARRELSASIHHYS